MTGDGTFLSHTSFWSYFVVSMTLIFIGLYAMWAAHNLIRVLIGMELMAKGVTLILAAAGFLTGNTGASQAMIIILIVMEVVVIVAAAGVVIGYFRKSGSLDTRTMNRLHG
jgi:NADH:ubiquinone oxidoreductase subunit K